MLEKYLKLFEAHERVIIITLVLAFAFFGWNKWLDKSAIDAQNKAAVAQQIAQVQRDADAKIATAVAQQTALFNQAQARYEQEIASLVNAVASRDAASTKRVKEVSNPDTTPIVAMNNLAQAYAPYTFNDPTPITPDGLIEFRVADVQQFTVAEIERQTATADLHDTQTQLDATKTQLDSAVSLTGSLQGQVIGLQTEIKKNDTAAKQELSACQATARKGKMKWFKIGFVTGFIGGLITGHAAGI